MDPLPGPHVRIGSFSRAKTESFWTTRSYSDTTRSERELAKRNLFLVENRLVSKKTSWRSRLDRFRQRFVLTPHEQRVVAFVVAAFLLGLFTKYYRETYPTAVPASTKAKPAKTRSTIPPKSLPAAKSTQTAGGF
jgi:hypothetical protein